MDRGPHMKGDRIVTGLVAIGIPFTFSKIVLKENETIQVTFYLGLRKQPRETYYAPQNPPKIV